MVPGTDLDVHPPAGVVRVLRDRGDGAPVADDEHEVPVPLRVGIPRLHERIVRSKTMERVAREQFGIGRVGRGPCVQLEMIRRSAGELGRDPEAIGVDDRQLGLRRVRVEPPRVVHTSHLDAPGRDGELGFGDPSNDTAAQGGPHRPTDRVDVVELRSVVGLEREMHAVRLRTNLGIHGHRPRRRTPDPRDRGRALAG